jgi:hypothetical protein
MPPPHQSEQTRRQAETIYKLRSQGKSFAAIAREMGMDYQTVRIIYVQECRLRELSFHYPIVEYISKKILKAASVNFGEEILEDPEKLRAPEVVKKVMLFPGIGNKRLKDFVQGLIEAGYEAIDVEQIKAEMYGKRWLN